MGRGSSKIGKVASASAGGAPAKGTIMDADEKFSAANGMGDIKTTADFNKEIDKVIKGVSATTAEEKTAVKTLRAIRKATTETALNNIIDDLDSDDVLSPSLYSAVYGFALNKARTMQPGWR